MIIVLFFRLFSKITTSRKTNCSETPCALLLGWTMYCCQFVTMVSPEPMLVHWKLDPLGTIISQIWISTCIFIQENALNYRLQNIGHFVQSGSLSWLSESSIRAMGALDFICLSIPIFGHGNIDKNNHRLQMIRGSSYNVYSDLK